MARTIVQILDAIIDEKENRTALDLLVPNPDDAQTFLDDLTTTSKVAIWRLMFFVIASAIFTHEKLFDIHKTAVEALADTLIPNTARFMREEALKFQFGDTLQFINLKFVYPVIDTTKQIIKRAAVVETGGQVIVKVAKLVATLPEKLTSSELNAFSVYINSIKSAGTQLAIISDDADLLKIAYNIHYDPQILENDGESIAIPTTFPVEDAINKFIQDLPFDSVLNLTELTDAIQAVSGVEDPVNTLAEGRITGGVFATIVREYTANAGHMKIDPAFPLSTQLTYIANV